MEAVRIEDAHFNQAEVSVTTGTSRGNVIRLDLDPDGYGDCQTLMQHSPEAALKLAAALILAAEETEAEDCDE